jgi:chromate reductase
MSESVTLCAIAGSLRKESYNRALLRAAQELAQEGLEIAIFDQVATIPLFNADVEKEGDPEPVLALKRAIGSADGLLIATPEYNHGVPGLLKNLLDWASRPPGESVLDGKPVGLIGATIHSTGTALAQSMLRQSFVFTNSPVMPQPEILIGYAHEKFADGPELVDGRTREFLAHYLGKLKKWVAVVGG